MCPPDAIAVLHAGFGLGSGPIHVDDVACTGSEAALINCTYDPITTDCTHIEDAGVRCSLTRMPITSTCMKFKLCDQMHVKVTYIKHCTFSSFCILSRTLQ